MIPSNKARAAKKSSKTSFWSVRCVVRSRLAQLLRGYNEILGISLSLPQLSSKDKEKELKGLLSAPLEGKPHPWKSEYRKVSRVARESISHSLFLFRKLLPGSPPSVDDFLSNMTSPQEDADPEFLAFARKTAQEVFPVGWDSVFYDRCVDNAVLNTSAYERSGVQHDCVREAFLKHYGSDSARDHYRSYCRGEWGEEYGVPTAPPIGSFIEGICGDEYDSEFTIRARIQAVPSGGKWRLVAMPSLNCHYLRPLHNAMYDNLRRQPWLLSSDAVPHRFERKTKEKGFVRIDGEQFYSGDYESATDNLNNEVQRSLLEAVLDNATHVPAHVKRLAMSSLRPLLYKEKPEEAMEMKRGQMMGFYLSFPLLCLVNYVTFKYFVRRDVPVRINGDDIVWRGLKSEFEKWSTGVQTAGLKLSVGKTKISRSFFSLNSALFRATETEVKWVPFVRSKALFGVADGSRDDPSASLIGRFNSCCVGWGRLNTCWRTLFLKNNYKQIVASGRSLSRGLGLPVLESELKAARLWDRECALLELPNEKPIPMAKSEWNHQPDGYHIEWRYTKEKGDKSARELLSQAFVAAAWKPPKQVDWYSEEFRTGLRVPILRYAKPARMLGMLRDQLKKLVETRRKSVFRRFRKPLLKYSVWVPDAPEHTGKPPVQFVSPDEESRHDEGWAHDCVPGIEDPFCGLCFPLTADYNRVFSWEVLTDFLAFGYQERDLSDPFFGGMYDLWSLFD